RLLRLALTHAAVSSVGTKDCSPDSPLPAELRDDPRVGRYLGPGGWCIPAKASHIYFVGPWRLLSWAMLLQATRSGTASLRCRVASALADAKRRKLERITLFFSHVAEPGTLREVLQKDGIASTGVKDTVVDSLLPADLAADRRIGRYWESGAWILPEPAEHVYF